MKNIPGRSRPSHRVPWRCLAALLTSIGLGGVEPISVSVPVWPCANEAGWSIWWPDQAQPKPYTLTPSAEGLVLHIEPGAEEVTLGLWHERYKNSVRLESSQELTCEVEVRSGSGLQLGLNLVDAQQEGCAYARQPLVSGVQTVRWSLTTPPQHTWGDSRNGRLDGNVGLWDVTVVRPAGATTAATIVLRGVHTRTSAQPASFVAVGLTDTAPLHLLSPGTAPSLRLQNAAPVPVTVSLAVTDEDWAGVTHAHQATITIPAAGSHTWSMPGSTPVRGIHWIEAAISDAPGGAPAVRERLPYAVLPGALPRPSAQGFLFGLNVPIPGPGPESPAELERTMEAVRWLGLRQVRTGANWDWLEFRPGQWNEAWLANLDQGVQRLTDMGVATQFLLSYTANHAAAPELRAGEYTRWLFSAPDLTLWRGYVRRMVDLLGDRVGMWEVWNEADLHDFWHGTYDQYRDLLRASHEEIKRGNLQRQVLNSGFAFCWPRDGRPETEFPWRLAREERAHFDVLAYHLHYDFQNFARILDQELRQLRDQAGNPPLLFNETAVNLDVFGERGQAEQLPKKLIYAWSHGAIGYSWFKLTGGLRRPVPGADRNWGVFTEDWHPRAVFVAYHTLLQELAEGTFRERLSGGPGRYAFRFDTPRGQVVAAWQEEGRGGRDPLVLSVGAGAVVTQVDLMGVETAVPTAKGFVVIPVSSTPVFVRITGVATPVVAAPALIRMQEQPLATPVRATVLPLAFANPTTTPLRLRVRWQVPTGAQALPETTIDLPASGSLTRAVPVTFQPGITFALGDSLPGSVELEVVGTPHRVRMPFNFLAAPALPAGPWKRPADLVRDDRNGLVEMHRNVPQREHRLWQGAGDLSWRAWLGRQGDRLALRVEVRDDVHVQHAAATAAWQHDSLQVAFSLPDGSTWWEFTYARAADHGAALMACGMGPAGGRDPHPHLHLTTTRTGDITTYETDWPLDVLGLTPAQLAAGLRCNLLVNDDDGDGRDGWIELAPGIGQQKDPHLFPLMLLE